MSWSDYSKIRKIGEGSFGSAWLVKHNRSLNQFVIKQINVAKMGVKERDEARKEVAVLAQMKHPFIVSYIDSFDENGNLCIVMDFCEGGDLYNKLRSMRGASIGEDQILDWFVQITLALKHVHDRKILHRDLKSQNIFLTKDGNIKLGDFGVAKVLGSTMDFARTAIGTPYYMSPEICEHRPYNNKSDVWSLGCILYEMINLRHPFEANNIQMLIYKILRGSYDQLNPKYSFELRNLVTCMLKKNPRERPSVNGILRKAFIMRRCEKFLTNEKLVEEFSHTVLHGENFKNKIQSLAVNKPKAITPRSNLNVNNGAGRVPLYDPSKVYKSPVVPRGPLVVQQPQQAAEKKPSTPAPAARKRPNSAQRDSVEERKQPTPAPAGGSYLEQQRMRRAAEEERLRKRQLELQEKQKMERINKAREVGWQNILPKKDESPPKEVEKGAAPEIVRVDQYPYVNFIRGSAYNNNNGNGNGTPAENIYERYHRQLDEFVEKRKPVLEQQEKIAKKLAPSPSPMPLGRPVVPGGIRRAVAAVGNSRPGSKNSQILEDFLKRKAEYERNKARAQQVAAEPSAAAVADAVKPTAAGNGEKWAYEQRLRRVREQNYENRRLLANNRNRLDVLPNNLRMQKVAALKQQSEEQRQKLRNELEKKRNEAFEREKKPSAPSPRPNSAVALAEQPKPKDIKPEPPVNITEVLSAIGVVGKKISKEEVLRNLNDEYYPKPESSRKSWQKATDLAELENKTLYKSDGSEKGATPTPTPRKFWDQPHESVLRGFELAKASSTSGSNLLLANERPPSALEKTLLKMGTLRASTKNLLLGMTLGQFDAKSTKMLRTVSEPDLSTLAAGDKDLEPSAGPTEAAAPVAQRLIRSLDELDKTKEEAKLDVEPIDLEEAPPIELPRKRLSHSGEHVEKDDISQVMESMASFLEPRISDGEDDDDNDVQIAKPGKRIVSFPSQNLVTSISVSQIQASLADSLEVSKKNAKKSIVINDENDCEAVELNGEEESEEEDTEFEDEIDKMPMPLVDKKVRMQRVEQAKLALEQKLGPKVFLQAYPGIQNQIMIEEADVVEKAKKLKDRKSFELFKRKFPNSNLYGFYELYDLIIAESKSE